MTYKSLTNTIKKFSPRVDLAEVDKAYNLAKKAHRGQKRHTGKPFIEHPLIVANIVARFNVDTSTIVASLLHDIVEDTPITLNDLRKEFGNDVAKVVEGETKISKIKFRFRDETYYIENIRKMLVAMAQDIRVVIIKLADRYHNMQTLDALPKEKQERIARETLEIYAPLASRLGMGELKGHLEDLAFPYLFPNEYAWTKKLISAELEKKEEYIEEVTKNLKRELKKAGVNVIDIHGRIKHLYSLYRKLVRYDNNINKIYDIIAIRVIVNNISACYESLGVIHKLWKPLIGRIKDYIATPKTNGYQSLHTTLICNQGEIVEIQIRTPDMHQEAEYGIAAHWHYNESSGKKDDQASQTTKDKIIWLNEILEWQKDLQDPGKFAESLQADAFKDRIFVFTPEGEVLDLPEGATPVDFAYHIHTEIGHRCNEAKVNYKLVSLDHKLENGDLVEIITGKKEDPKRDWLYFVKTSIARNNIRNWMKKISRKKNLDYGRELLSDELKRVKKPALNRVPKSNIKKLIENLPYKSLDDILVALGQGDLTVNQIIKNIYGPEDVFPQKPKKFFFFGPESTVNRAIIAGEGGFLTNFAKCCNPASGDEIKAHISRAKGAIVHKADCKELKKIDEGRITAASWEEDYENLNRVAIEIKSFDRVGLIKDITSIIADYEINILSFDLKNSRKNDILIGRAMIEIKDLDQLVGLLHDIEKIKGVTEAKRI